MGNISILRDDLKNLIEDQEDLEYAQKEAEATADIILQNKKEIISMSEEIHRLNGVISGLNSRLSASVAMGNSVQLKPGHRVLSTEHADEAAGIILMGMGGKLSVEKHKILCIKAYRNLTGKTVFQSKDAIESVWKLPSFTPAMNKLIPGNQSDVHNYVPTYVPPAKASDTRLPHELAPNEYDVKGSDFSSDEQKRLRVSSASEETDDHSISTE